MPCQKCPCDLKGEKEGHVQETGWRFECVTEAGFMVSGWKMKVAVGNSEQV